MYEASFREYRELPALTDYFKKESFSYYEMAKEIARLHMLFGEAKLRRGDKVGLIGRNSPRWVITYVATITYGAVVVPVLQDFNQNDINHIINHSDARLLFVSDSVWDVVSEDKVREVKAIFSLTDFSCIYERNGESLTRYQKEIVKHYRARYPKGFRVEDINYPEIGNDEICLLSYTSGTTGFSKGVMLTVNNLTGQVAFCLPKRRHFAGSRVLSFLPLAHAYGCAIDMLCSLAAGTHITLLGRIPSPKILLGALGEVKPHVICSVPLVVEKVVKKQIFPILGQGWMRAALKVPGIDTTIYSTIRKKLMHAFGGELIEVVIGGAPLNAEVEEFMHKIKFPVVVGYGMTECGPLISYSGYDEGYKPGSAGRVVEPYMEARIDSPDPQNIPGEIQVRGDNVMKGYYKNNEAAAEIFTPDGWLRTGDMGTMDADHMLYIRGRSKSMILLASGQNIYPEEIEAKLNNLDYVMESLVVERDGKLVALVVPDYEQVDQDDISSGELPAIMDKVLKELNKLVAPYERVSGIVLYPSEFEKTPKKSIRRYLYTV